MTCKKLKDSIRCYDRILSDIRKEELFDKRQEAIFSKHIQKDDEESIIKIMKITMDWKHSKIEKKFPDVKLSDRFIEYVSVNRFIYYLLKTNKYIKDVSDFLNRFVENQENRFYLIADKIRGCPKAEPDDLAFFWAKKWFLSKNTKQFFSEKLLLSMKDYERKLNEIDWTECLITISNKYWRLKK